MSSAMAKRKGPRARSAYQTHVSILFPGEEATKHVIDLTERKLVRIAMRHTDENIRKLAARMLHDYVTGKIAVAWEDGTLPVYIFLRA